MIFDFFQCLFSVSYEIINSVYQIIARIINDSIE